MNETKMIALELIGGPFDGDKIEVYPEMNSRFFIPRNGSKSWYLCHSTGKAYYLAPRKDK